ncbi:hypothetical protein [Bacillus sp. 1NLA3E]|uniref:hypothetical protein n=1 Tax=Bacillus sp. 1NLA3E TaxID=666686 RepID=UPI000247E66A|nr:hypothetical protein [Bacillus sp. 1NLA3E]AGK52009.1 hypothetical protein B1NLA3E_01125 [Bacillus sp. 1NLA3E]
MPEICLIGFNGPDPFSIIVWQLDGVDRTKTICYTTKEELNALERFHTAGDFYNRYDKAVVVYQDKQSVEYVKIPEKKGA